MSGLPAATTGSVVAGRYRLRTPLRPTPVGGAPLWLADDEVLARQVVVRLLRRDDPYCQSMLQRARVAAGLTKFALANVYDAGEDPDVAFVVTEYLSGGNLEQLLRAGPVEPLVAIELVSQIAIAVTAAHAAGLTDLAPAPRRVLFDATGAPRLVEIPSFSGGPINSPINDPADDGLAAARLRDTRALGRLLYAALTSRWPGDTTDSTLPAAPLTEGHLRSPRQVRGGVPRELDAVVVQALGDDALRHGLPELQTPADLVQALEPLIAAAADGHPYDTDTQPIPVVDSNRRRSARPRPVPALAGKRVRWALAVIAVVVIAAALRLASVGPRNYLHFSSPPPATTPTPSPSVTASTPATALSPRSIAEFDPYGSHNDPHVSEAHFADDGDPATAWHTQTFASPALGNLKPGIGLLVDLGTPRRVATVDLTLLGTGTDVELFTADGVTAPTTEKQMTLAASADGAPSHLALHLHAPASGRYWLIWLTRLPATSKGYQGGVAEVAFAS